MEFGLLLNSCEINLF